MARLLLDTNAALWLSARSPRLGSGARAAIERAARATELFVSAYSIVEVATMDARGRLPFAQTIGEWRSALLGSGVQEAAIDGVVAERSADFPVLRGDPADRVILACAAVERCTLLTSDVRLLAWRGSLPRMDARR